MQASQITAKGFLQLVPDKLEMSFNETHTVQAILSETLDNDVSLDLISFDPPVAGPSIPVLVIPAGEMSASFEVTSASIEGETFIQASLGSETATVEVQVEEQHQQEELGVNWHPEWLEAEPNESKSVQLVLGEPAPLDFAARLTLKEGPHDLVEFPHEVHFAQGSQEATVLIHIQDVTALTHSQSNTQGVIIQAMLPEDLGGAYAHLWVEMVGDHREELEVFWHPEWIEVAPNQSKSVQLVLGGPTPLDFAARLSLKEGPHDLVEFPHEVHFAQGSQEATVLIQTQGEAGGAVIRASLPHSVGGASAYLKVEIWEDDAK